ncbi:MAG: hypothetical protein KDC34_16170 [Saprospiraceae bacterium]|nr:hypothetical protein [Saprospiraceae bacterium]
MRLKIPFILLLFPILFSGCKNSLDLFEDFDDYLPVIEIKSISMIDDFTAQVIIEIISEGAAEINYAGMQHSLSPDMSLFENHTLVQSPSASFILEAKELEHSTTYYFRAFAANDYGHYYGSILSFDVPGLSPPDVPCTIPENLVINDGVSHNANVINHGTDVGNYTYGINVDCPSAGFMVNVFFNKVPENGIYNTSTYANLEGHEQRVLVEIAFDGGFQTVPTYSGKKLYVVENEDGSKNVIFCDLSYTVFTTEIPIVGNFRLE